ncbi:MAG: hypothetical protein BWX93_00115 [Bacteroidetes bacterium ADurb.Bin139]|nr:MAG: hypothetical protein BWX93_00115 [Bacteroidetes bacterium ADurb.Bin139]
MAGIVAAACFLFFLLHYPYHNLLKEQMILFLHSEEYFLTYLAKPAWLSCYAGDLLTQFYIHPAGSALIITASLLAEWLLFRRVFQKFGIRSPFPSLLAAAPVIIEFLFHCGLHYPLSSTFSTLLALVTLIAFMRLRSNSLYFWLAFPTAAILYLLAGHGIILFTVGWLIGGILRKGLHRYFLILPAVCSLAMPLLVRTLFLLSPVQAYRYPIRKPLTVNVDMTWKKILELDYESQQGNWSRVLLLSREYAMQNRIASYYTNLALSQTNLMGEWLFHFYQPGPAGLFLPATPQSTPLMITFANEVFFYLGDLNMAQHAAMLGMIFSPCHRSSRLVKRLAGIHIAIGDAPAAGKYLGLLEKTLFYRKWAVKSRELQTVENIPLREKIPSVDTIRLADDYITSLEILLQSNPENKMALDYLLCYHILNKDIPSFRQAYDKWFHHAHERIPGVYAQALIVSLFQEKADNEVLKKYNMTTSVIGDFMDYTRTYEEAGGLSAPLQERYGNTFWFYYHFALIQ